MADDEPKTTAMGRPMRQPWRPFDESAQEDFLKAIRAGVRSRSAVMRLLGLNPTTVNRWIGRGKSEDYTDADIEYRYFYLRLLAAEAERLSVADVTLLNAARMDWKAADAVLRRQERVDERQAMGVHIEREAKAKADEAEAAARLAKARAEVAERAANKFAGVVLLPPEFLERCQPEEREMLEAAMRRERLIQAPEAMVEEILAEQDTSDLEELEDGLRRHPRRGIEQP